MTPASHSEICRPCYSSWAWPIDIATGPFPSGDDPFDLMIGIGTLTAAGTVRIELK